jgi:hypothetical protein
LGSVRAFGSECTGSCGAGLSRALQASGHRVLDINRADRSARRRHGKDDPLDAEAAARTVLSGQATTLAKSGTSSVERIGHLKLARDSAVKARAQAMQMQAMQMLKALIVSAPAELREQLEGTRGKVTRVRHLTALRPGPMTSTTASAKVGLQALVRRWLLLSEEIQGHDRGRDALAAAHTPELITAPGIATASQREPPLKC